jgi:hypothetical protein
MSVAGGLLADLNWAPALCAPFCCRKRKSENISDIYIFIRTSHNWHVSEFIHYLSSYIHASLHRHTYIECDTWWAPCRDKWHADAQSRGTLSLSLSLQISFYSVFLPVCVVLFPVVTVCLSTLLFLSIYLHVCLWICVCWPTCIPRTNVNTWNTHTHQMYIYGRVGKRQTEYFFSVWSISHCRHVHCSHHVCVIL